MNSNSIIYVIIMMTSVFIASVSQVVLKKAALKKYDSRIKEYLNPQVIFAYFLFTLTTFISVYAYRGIPLSMGPILESTGYIYVTFFGVKIFGEKINKRKIGALLLIIVGIAIYGIWG